MPEPLAITRFLNALFAGAVDALMNLVGVHPANPAAPINDTFALELLVFAILVAFFLIVRFSLSVEKPNAAQQMAEIIHEFTGSNADQIIGHGYERFQGFVTCIFLFVILNNLLGLIPGIVTRPARQWCRLASPYALLSTTTSTGSRSRASSAT